MLCSLKVLFFGPRRATAFGLNFIESVGIFGLSFLVSTNAIAQSSASNNATSGEGSVAVPSPLATANGQSTDDQNLGGQTPRMEFERTRHSFGNISRGQKVSYSFGFVNAGKGVLTIRSIHSSCGCLETKVTPKDTFAAGEVGKIEFVFDSRFFVGEVVRTITIDTNAKALSTQTLSFSANVLPELLFKPNLLALGEIPKETSKAFKIQVLGMGRSPSPGAPGLSWDSMTKNGVADKSISSSERSKIMQNKGDMELVTIVSSSKFLEAEIEERDVEKQVWSVKVKLVPPLPIGSFREKITILSNATHLKIAEIPVSAEVVGHVRASSKYLEFGVVAANKAVRRSLTLQSDLSNFAIKGVDLEFKKSDALKLLKTSDLIKTSLERNADGVTIHFDLQRPKKFPADTQNINASGFLLVRTNDPDYAEMRVPFFGILRNDTR